MLQGLRSIYSGRRECFGKAIQSQRYPSKILLPMGLPKNLPHASSVAERMKNTISFVFGQTYKGFCPETKLYLSDSEAASLSSGSDDEKRRDVEDCYPLEEAMAGMLEIQFLSENTDSDDRRKKRKSQKEQGDDEPFQR